jgi:glycosyltransferase involved in cell wall biosynthesis
MRRPRLLYAVTHPTTADTLLRGQLTFMREHGFDVTVVGAPGPILDRVRDRERVTVQGIPMPRAANPADDLRALGNLIAYFRKVKPDIVNAGTTKAGLLGMMAARAANVPIRVYLLRGLRLETVHGPMRTILGVTERIASACAHDVVSVSDSVLRLAVGGGYIQARKARVLGAGSSNGVDTERYQRSEALRRDGTEKLAALGIPPDAPLVGFVGRLVSDKGIDELLSAFERVRAEMPDAHLALLGGDLGDEVSDPALVERVRAAKNVVATGMIADLAPYYARIDVLAFPSFREGFPNVTAEAASAEVPVVAFETTGTVDSVADGESGTIVPQGDAAELAHGILTYLLDPKLARSVGRAARARAIRLFACRIVWENWLDFYRDRLAERGLPVPQDDVAAPAAAVR